MYFIWHTVCWNVLNFFSGTWSTILVWILQGSMCLYYNLTQLVISKRRGGKIDYLSNIPASKWNFLLTVKMHWHTLCLPPTDAGFEFDICYTSVLKRAIRTLWLVLDSIDQMWVPVHRTWRLNERHYGGLTGLNKAETAAKHGEAQVKIWRRSFDIPPPSMGPDHDYYTIISKVRYDINSTCTQQGALLAYEERNVYAHIDQPPALRYHNEEAWLELIFAARRYQQKWMECLEWKKWMWGHMF